MAHLYGYLRRPQTQAERTANSALKADYNDIIEVAGKVLTVRAKRRTLPTVLDDMPSTTTRSWKEFRDTQYHPVYVLD